MFAAINGCITRGALSAEGINNRCSNKTFQIILPSLLGKVGQHRFISFATWIRNRTVKIMSSWFGRSSFFQKVDSKFIELFELSHQPAWCQGPCLMVCFSEIARALFHFSHFHARLRHVISSCSASVLRNWKDCLVTLSISRQRISFTLNWRQISLS